MKTTLIEEKVIIGSFSISPSVTILSENHKTCLEKLSQKSNLPYGLEIVNLHLLVSILCYLKF